MEKEPKVYLKVWRLAVADAISQFGAWIVMMALYSQWVFRSEGGGVWETSGILLAGLCPQIFVSPVAGRLIENLDKRKVISLTQWMTMPLIFLINSTTEYSLLLVLLATQAALGSFVMPARVALLPQLVNSDEFVQGNAVLQRVSSLVKILAPVLAGSLISLIGVTNSYFLHILCLALSGFIVFHLKLSSPAKILEEEKGKERGPLSFGFVALAACMFLTILSLMGFEVLAPSLVKAHWTHRESYFGQLISCVGAGSLLASYFMGRLRHLRPSWIRLALGIAGTGLMTLGYGISSELEFIDLEAVIWSLRIFSFVGGVSICLVNIEVYSLLQSIVESERLSTASGILQSVIAIAQIGAVMGIPLLFEGLNQGNPLRATQLIFGLMSLALILVASGVVLKAFLSARRRVDYEIQASRAAL